VLGITARVKSKAKDSKRFFYEDCNTPFASEFALASHLETNAHAKRVANVPLAPLSTYAQNAKAVRQAAKASGKH
jgi:hypothetical protein